MFNSRNLLVALIAASVSFGVGNDWTAIAQNAKKSQRYVSDQEIQSLDQNFQSSIREFRADDRTQRMLTSGTNQLNDFVNAWQKVDPSIAPYLGSWATIEGRTVEGSTMIYPSQTKGKVCVVMLDYFGSRFNLGTVVSNKLLVTGEIGKSVIIRKRSTLQSGIEVNSLALFSVFDGRVGVWAKIYPSTLSGISDSRLAKFGCTTEFPVINLNAGQSLSNKHPAEVVVLDFYACHYGKGRQSNYFAFLAQDRNKFTSDFYRNLERGLRISNRYSQTGKGINFDLLSESQAGVFSFQVGSVTTNRDRVEVPVTVNAGLRYPGVVVPIKVVVVKNGSKWQIEDLIYRNFKLMDLLRVINADREFQNLPWEK